MQHMIKYTAAMSAGPERHNASRSSAHTPAAARFAAPPASLTAISARYEQGSPSVITAPSGKSLIWRIGARDNTAAARCPSS